MTQSIAPVFRVDRDCAEADTFDMTTLDFALIEDTYCPTMTRTGWSHLLDPSA